MKKPTDLELWLHESWPISGLSIDYVQTGTDSAETRATITGAVGKKTFLWKSVRDLLNLGVDYNSVARLNGGVMDRVAAYKDWEKQNAADLKELERLKKKLNIP